MSHKYKHIEQTISLFYFEETKKLRRNSEFDARKRFVLAFVECGIFCKKKSLTNDSPATQKHNKKSSTISFVRKIINATKRTERKKSSISTLKKTRFTVTKGKEK